MSEGAASFEEATSMDTGRVSSFEVMINSKYLAYSKLAKKTFPEDPEALASSIGDFAVSGKVPSDWVDVTK